MKKVVLGLLTISTALSLSAQHYIQNGGFEQWENEGLSTVEPVNWNSFRTADGGASSYAPANPVATKITDAHSGDFAVKIVTVQGPFGVIVNGNLTLGRVHMGSTQPTNQNNHNHTVPGDPLFSEAIVNTPDSVIVWIRYAGVGADSASISAQVHDDYGFEFPEDTESQSHAIAYARKAFATTNDWTRVSFPFQYTGLSTEDPAYILINLTSSAIPGGGEIGSTFYVDDIQLEYNELNINDATELPYSVHNTPEGIIVNMKSSDRGIIEVRNLAGQLIQSKNTDGQLTLVNVNTDSGIYLVSIKSEKGQKTEKIFIK